VLMHLDRQTPRRADIEYKVRGGQRYSQVASQEMSEKKRGGRERKNSKGGLCRRTRGRPAEDKKSTEMCVSAPSTEKTGLQGLTCSLLTLSTSFDRIARIVVSARIGAGLTSQDTGSTLEGSRGVRGVEGRRGKGVNDRRRELIEHD
jgi:hypothetical protein